MRSPNQAHLVSLQGSLRPLHRIGPNWVPVVRSISHPKPRPGGDPESVASLMGNWLWVLARGHYPKRVEGLC
jgi:hypothetical protein